MLREPGLTGFLGAIGSDNFGDRLQSCAKGDGVETHYYVDPATPTGTCAVLLNSNHRSLVANLAAANKFEPSHLETEKASAMLGSARLFYIAGFFLTVSLEAILKVAKTATEERKVSARFFCRPFVRGESRVQQRKRSVAVALRLGILVSRRRCEQKPKYMLISSSNLESTPREPRGENKQRSGALNLIALRRIRDF